MFKCLYLKNTFMRIGVVKQLQFFCQTSANNVKYKSTFCKLYHSSPNYAFRVKNTRNLTQETARKQLQVDTNVQNNVLLFKNENTAFPNRIKLFTFGWLFCSTVIAYYSFSSKFISLISTSANWKDYLKQCGIRIFYFIYIVVTGPSLVLIVSFYIRRYVKYVILQKGGEHVSLITYNLFKNELLQEVPVKQIRSTLSRNEIKNYMQLKVQFQSFYYLMDAKGTFLNIELFDNTIGAAKNWK